MTSPKGHHLLTVGLFCTYLVGFSCWQLLTPTQLFSETENRYLATRPSWSLAALLSGSLGTDLETYLSDQWPRKDDWVSLKSDLERLSGRISIKGVYETDDGRLVSTFEVSQQEEEQLLQSIQRIEALARRRPDLTVVTLIAPNAIALYESELYPYRLDDSQAQWLKTLEAECEATTFVDVLDVLQQHQTSEELELYFKTDHHWTPDGAYFAYQALGGALGYEPYSLSHFQKDVVSEAFYGTLYAKANQTRLAPDLLWRYVPTFSFEATLTIPENDLVVDGLYVEEHLSKRDQYPYFLDGNHGLAIVEGSIANGEKLLVAKDSYAHVLIPFLALHFEEIHVVDVRYFKLNGVSYAEANQIDTLLFLYNLETFSTDASLRQLVLWK